MFAGPLQAVHPKTQGTPSETWVRCWFGVDAAALRSVRAPASEATSADGAMQPYISHELSDITGSSKSQAALAGCFPCFEGACWVPVCPKASSGVELGCRLVVMRWCAQHAKIGYYSIGEAVAHPGFGTVYPSLLVLAVLREPHAASQCS